MSPGLEQLHDIEGLDPISWWPLAVGWWVLFGIAFSTLSALVCFVIYKIAFRRSWKSDTFRKLARLEKNLSDATSRETVMVLSEYLRRIALKRFSRKECAGLVGQDWLKWLAAHDPQNFDWEKKGIPLIDIPYAPLDYSVPSKHVKDLIEAVKAWVY